MGAQIGFNGTDLRYSMSATASARHIDLGDNMRIVKVALVMAQVEDGAWEVNRRLFAIIPGLKGFGEVMALKRNSGGMNEKSETYDHYPAFLKVMISLTELTAKEVV